MERTLHEMNMERTLHEMNMERTLHKMNGENFTRDEWREMEVYC